MMKLLKYFVEFRWTPGSKHKKLSLTDFLKKSMLYKTMENIVTLST